MQISLIGLDEKVNTQSIKCAAELVLTIVQVQDESPGCNDQSHHLQILYFLQALHIQHGVSGVF